MGAFVAFCRAFLRPATAITMTALTTTMPAMSAMPLSDESPLSALLSAAGRAVGRLGVVGVAGWFAAVGGAPPVGLTGSSLGGTFEVDGALVSGKPETAGVEVGCAVGPFVRGVCAGPCAGPCVGASVGWLELIVTTFGAGVGEADGVRVPCFKGFQGRGSGTWVVRLRVSTRSKGAVHKGVADQSHVGVPWNWWWWWWWELERGTDRER